MIEQCHGNNADIHVDTENGMHKLVDKDLHDLFTTTQLCMHEIRAMSYRCEIRDLCMHNHSRMDFLRSLGNSKGFGGVPFLVICLKANYYIYLGLLDLKQNV